MVVITYPVNESTLTATTTIKADVADDSDISSVKFLIDGTEAYADATAPYEYEWDVCVFGTGSHSVLVKAEDSAGNKGQSDISTFTLNASYDCALVCGGDKLLDNCGTCDADTSNDCTADCNSEYGGTAVLDVCGVCDDDSTNDGAIDNCGVCDNDSTNDCTKDCADVWGGTSWVSDCGCVSATNSGDDCDDCAGTPNGTAVVDDCGVCNGGNESKDDCGVCDGDGIMLWGNCYSIANTTELDLNANGLTDNIPSKIGSLTNLEKLALYDNQLTGSIPSEIGSLTKLKGLFLQNNQLTGSIPSEIANLTNLTDLDLSYNQLTGNIPESICVFNINWSSSGNFYITDNKLCPLYPSCVENYVGVQNTSECPSEDVTGIDGNTYKTVIIGTQTWMAENLKTTKYKNGDAIPNITQNANSGGWDEQSTGAYCDFNNDASISVTHGRLYNWYAGNDSRGVCMEGWHVPSKDEWENLINYLGGTDYAGGKMKEEGTTHWKSPNTGATNESGFTALAMGWRNYAGGGWHHGISGDDAHYAYYWSSTGTDSYHAYKVNLYYENTQIHISYTGNAFGMSIRCIKD